MSQAEKTLYGIIGYPLDHTLSPLMHNTAFQELDIPAEYRAFPLKEEQLETFFKELKKEDCPVFGLNVTVPYKEKVIPYLDSLAPFAQKAGAVNTILIKDDRTLVGYNTDGPGFLSHLAELGFVMKDKNVAILGAGGSTRAILAALCLMEDAPRKVRIYNRTTERAEELLNDLITRIPLALGLIEVVKSIDDLDLLNADLLVNTTSVGLKAGDESLVEEDLLHKKMLVYDLVYNPPKTALLKLAEKKGAKISNGLGMLFYQGVLSFQRWGDILLEDDIKDKMRAALEKGAGI